MKKILVIGSLNLDFTIDLKRIPYPGETVHGKSISQIPGGKGANQAYAAGKLGGLVSMIGCVGKEHTGNILIKNLQSAGVDTSGIAQIENIPSGQAYIALEETGENCIIVIPGANEFVTRDLIDKNMHLIEQCDFILMQFEIPLDTIRYVKEISHSLGKTVIIDPAPAVANLEEDFWKDIDILKPNETELEIIAGRKLNSKYDYITAARKLIDKGVKTVIVTLGKAGCVLVDNVQSQFFHTEKVEVVDTTAAGDCFTAAFAVALSEEMNVSDAINFAQRASAIAVTRKGAQTSIPSREELDWGDAI